MRRSLGRGWAQAQGTLDFTSPRGSPVLARSYEEAGSSETLMEQAVLASTVTQAISRVKRNRGSAGLDGMTVDDLDEFWLQHGERICQVLLAGDYVPRPVRRVVIPKPGGGERLLGIPTVVDRVVQQMLQIVLEPIFEPHFFGFELRLSPGSFLPRRDPICTVNCGDGPPLGGGHRSGEVLRHCEPRRPDVEVSPPYKRQASAQAGASVPKFWRDGKRCGCAVPRWDSARRPALPFVSQCAFGRSRQVHGVPWLPLCAVRGRLQHLCEFTARRRTGDGNGNSLLGGEAPPTGQRR